MHAAPSIGTVLTSNALLVTGKMPLDVEREDSITGSRHRSGPHQAAND